MEKFHDTQVGEDFKKSSLTSDTTKITGLQKKNQKDGIILNTKTFTHQNTQSIEEKVNLQNGRKYFQITYLIRG